MNEIIPTVLIIAALASWGAFIAVERRMRPRWRERVVGETAVGPPYRGVTLLVRSGERAPRVVRVAALSGLLLGSVAVPGVLWAMATLRFDGIALSLLPAVGSALGAWCAGWLLLARRPLAVDLGRTTVVVSMASSVMLLALALAHLFAARAGWSDSASPQYTALAIALALAGLPQAMLLRRAIVSHANAFLR